MGWPERPSLGPSAIEARTFGKGTRGAWDDRREVQSIRGVSMVAPHAPSAPWRDRGRLQTIRIRLVLALLLPFVSLMGVSTIQAFAAAAPGDRLPAVLILVAAGISLPALMALLAR